MLNTNISLHCRITAGSTISLLYHGWCLQPFIVLLLILKQLKQIHAFKNCHSSNNFVLSRPDLYKRICHTLHRTILLPCLCAHIDFSYYILCIYVFGVRISAVYTHTDIIHNGIYSYTHTRYTRTPMYTPLLALLSPLPSPAYLRSCHISLRSSLLMPNRLVTTF